MTNTEIARTEAKPPHPIVLLGQRLDARDAELKAALPAHITPEKFKRVVKTAAQINPEIIACEWQSLWNACMRAANDGLLPDGVEGAIVAYGSKATWIPMVQGLLKKFRNSGEFKWVGAGLVYEGDEYRHHIDETGEHFFHRPADDNSGKKIRRIYALATTKDGGSFIADMSMSEIEKRRNKSRARRDDSPWQQWPEEMMKKTALRQLSKYLPKSSDIEALMLRDDEDSIEQIEEHRPAIVRPIGTAAALDTFGAVSESLSAAAPEEGGARQTDLQPATTESTDAAHMSDSAIAASESAPASADQSEAERKAYERGKQDRAKGALKKAVPGDLRENSRFAIAWTRGWDEGMK